MSVYNYDYTSIDNQKISMRDYEGKVLLIVNTASECGFTPQYEGLEALYKKYKDKGFVVLGFPCNQFLGQEPGSEEDISKFCSIRYGVTFPLSKKVDVRDETKIPLYEYLISQKGFSGLGDSEKAKEVETFLKGVHKDSYEDDEIKWNFTKFLIARDGSVFGRYEPTVEPQDIAPDIEKLL
jgi:glutathione peroxidase